LRDAIHPSGSHRSTSEDSRLNAEATAWLIRLASGEATTEDAEAVQRWCSQSRAHGQAFAEAKLLWQLLGPASDMLSETTPEPAAVLPLRPRPQLARRAFLGGALAASVAAVGYLGSRPPFRLWPSPEELVADYRTGTGGRQTVAIGDNVSIVLNTQTSIDMRASNSGRRGFELIDGEASITMKADADVEVLAAFGRTTASAAHFTIRRDNASVCVTCLRGEVSVRFRGQVASVSPGHQIVYDADSLKPAVAADVVVSSAWERGQLIFRHEPFARVVHEINRYRPGKIVLLNDKLGERDVVATFQLSRIDAALDHLAETFGARLRRLPGGMILLS
jgi:transmembrane sensor